MRVQSIVMRSLVVAAAAVALGVPRLAAADEPASKPPTPTEVANAGLGSAIIATKLGQNVRVVGDAAAAGVATLSVSSFGDLP